MPVTYDIPENRAFLSAFQAEYKNELPDWSDGEMYQALMILFAAIEKAGSAEPMKIVAAMEGLEVTSVKGPVLMRKCDHQGENQGFVVKVAQDREVRRSGGRDRQDLSARADHAGLPQRQLPQPRDRLVSAVMHGDGAAAQRADLLPPPLRGGGLGHGGCVR